MKIAGMMRTTTIDYPGKISSILFLDGCNFRCGFCHNPELVTKIKPETFMDEDDVFNLLEERKHLVDAVVISGGEPSLKSDLPVFIKKLKDKGFFVKLDSNGYLPEVLEKLIDEKLLDYIAMDIKANLTEEAYSNACGVKIDISKIKKSISLIQNSGLPYEFRTTIFPRIIPKEDLYELAEKLKGSQKYVLQQLVNSENMLNEDYFNSKIYEPDELKEFQEKIKDYFDKFEIRGI